MRPSGQSLIAVGFYRQFNRILVLSQEFTISGSPDPLTLEVRLPDTVKAGDTIQAIKQITGGTEPYTVENAAWIIYEGEEQAGYRGADFVDDIASFIPLYGTKGRLFFAVTDGTGRSVYFGQEFLITDSPAPLSVNITLPETVKAGTPITASWEISGGAEPYIVNDRWWRILEGDQQIGFDLGSLFANSSAYTPLYGTKGEFHLVIVDGTGRWKEFSKSFSITESPEPLVLDLTLPSTVQAGQSIQASWTIGGGVAPYLIEYSNWTLFDGDEYAGNHYSNAVGSTSTLVPKYGTSGSFGIRIKDASGRSVDNSHKFTITGSPEPLTLDVSLPDKVKAGSPISAHWQVNGGVKPYIVENAEVFIWTNGSDRFDYQPSIDLSGNSASFTPLFGISGEFTINIKDATGRIKGLSKGFAITNASSGLECNIVLDKSEVSAGESINASWTFSGSEIPIRVVSVMWSAFEEQQVYTRKFLYGDLRESSFIPLAGNTGSLYINVQDANGKATTFVSEPFTIKGAVLPPPLEGDIILSSSSVLVGEEVKAELNFTSGVPPYTVDEWTWVTIDKDGQKINTSASIDGYTASFKPLFGTSCEIWVFVSDATGQYTQFVNSFEITGDNSEIAEPLRANISLDNPLGVAIGDTITASWTIHGGTSPYASKAYWVLNDDGEKISAEPNEWNNQVGFSPQRGTSAYFRLEVQDALGRQKAVNSPPFVISAAAPIVPTSMVTANVHNGTVGVPIYVPRPTLLPEGSILSSENFRFSLNVWGLLGNGESIGNSDDGYNITFSKPGYYSGSVSLSSPYAQFGQSVMFIIKDESGELSANPIHFIQTELEEVLYLNGNYRVGGVSASLDQDISGLGTPVWTLSPVNGSSVENLRISRAEGHYCNVLFDIVNAGDTSSVLTCTLGEFSASIPIMIRVIGGPVPTSIFFEKTLFEAAAGETITFPHPQIHPADTSLTPDMFTLHISGDWESRNLGSLSTDGMTCTVVIDEPGYYSAYVWMDYANISLRKTLAFVIRDADGNLPEESPISFVENYKYFAGYGPVRGDAWTESQEAIYIFKDKRIEATLHMNSRDENFITVFAGEPGKLSAFGDVVWSITNIVGSAATPRIIGSNDWQCSISFDPLLTTGDVSFTLTCTVGAFSSSVEVVAHIVDFTRPTSMQLRKTQYQARINEDVKIYRPTLLPLGTELDETAFFFNIIGADAAFYEGDLGMTWPDDNQYVQELSFSYPGYYTAKAIMSCDNIYLTQDIFFSIADADGKLPLKKLIESIEMSSRSLTMAMGEIAQLAAVISPIDASFKALSWSSDKEAIVTVSQTGRVTAIGSGSATITAGAMDGSGTISTCKVIIPKDINKTSLDALPESTYTGLPIEADIVIKDSDYVLIPGKDYTLSYQNNVNAGTASVAINGIGGYSGTRTSSFIINKASYDMSEAGWDYTVSIPYDGTIKTVLVTGLPAGVIIALYAGNTGTNPGTYTASATFTYDTQNYNEPVIATLTWEIIDPIILGDANGDGSVDIMDLVAIIDYIVGSSQVGSAANADANGDGVIDIMDLVWIIDCIVGG